MLPLLVLTAVRSVDMPTNSSRPRCFCCSLLLFLQLFDLMESRGLTPDPVTFSVAFKAAEDTGRAAWASEMLEVKRLLHKSDSSRSRLSGGQPRLSRS